MKAKYRKRLEKAAQIIREVIDELEDKDQDSFDAYSEELEQAAEAIDDVLLSDERRSEEDDDEDDSFWEE